jgi:hypothetical protein
MLDKQREDEGFNARLKTFDPEVDGVIFWPAIVGLFVVALSVAVSS